MTFDEAVKVVDKLLTEQARAAKNVRAGGALAPMRLTPIERRSIERVLDRALDRTEETERSNPPAAVVEADPALRTPPRTGWPL